MRLVTPGRKLSLILALVPTALAQTSGAIGTVDSRPTSSTKPITAATKPASPLMFTIPPLPPQGKNAIQDIHLPLYHSGYAQGLTADEVRHIQQARLQTDEDLLRYRFYEYHATEMGENFAQEKHVSEHEAMRAKPDPASSDTFTTDVRQLPDTCEIRWHPIALRPVKPYIPNVDRTTKGDPGKHQTPLGKIMCDFGIEPWGMGWPMIASPYGRDASQLDQITAGVIEQFRQDLQQDPKAPLKKSITKGRELQVDMKRVKSGPSTDPIFYEDPQDVEVDEVYSGFRVPVPPIRRVVRYAPTLDWRPRKIMWFKPGDDRPDHIVIVDWTNIGTADKHEWFPTTIWCIGFPLESVTNFRPHSSDAVVLLAKITVDPASIKRVPPLTVLPFTTSIDGPFLNYPPLPPDLANKPGAHPSR